MVVVGGSVGVCVIVRGGWCAGRLLTPGCESQGREGYTRITWIIVAVRMNVSILSDPPGSTLMGLFMCAAERVVVTRILRYVEKKKKLF